MKTFERIYIPLGWTIMIQVLLCLPGSVLPSTEGYYSISHLDKVVHVILFSIFVISWSLYFRSRVLTHDKLKWIFFLIFLCAAANGILIEYIQMYFIPNRSFDNGDIIADLLSSSVAYGVCNVKFLTCGWKKLPNV